MAYDKNRRKLYIDKSSDKGGLALWEIYDCLRYNKRDSRGNRNLGMAIVNGRINPLARCKPFRDSATSFASAEARAAVRGASAVNSGANNGFGNTPMITPSGYTIPHAVYEYKRPRGVTSETNEPFRMSDFDGYWHFAPSPIKVAWESKIYTGSSNKLAILVNFADESGWNQNECLRLDEVLDDNLNEAYFALLITRGNGEYWLMPTKSKVSASSEYQIIYIEFAPSQDKLDSDIAVEWNKTVFPDLLDATDDTEYQIAVVATMTPYPNASYNTAIKTTQQVYSLELSEGSDRITLPVQRAGGLAGISGKLNTTWVKSAGTAVNSFVPYSLNGTKLKVHLKTTDAWTRTSVYVEVKLSLESGWFANTENSQILELVLGKEVLIGASTEGDFEIADLKNYTAWVAQAAPNIRMNASVTAWRNADHLGNESRPLSTESFTI